MVWAEGDTKTFHLTNNEISYLIKVLPNGTLGQLYFGPTIRHRQNFDYLLELKHKVCLRLLELSKGHHGSLITYMEM